MERNLKERLDPVRSGGGESDGLESEEIHNLNAEILNLNEVIKDLQDELSQQKIDKERLLKEQQLISFAAKQSDQRLKISLQDSLSLHQRLNRLEEELNQSRTEISDLHGQVSHERAIASERQESIQKLHGVQQLVNDLRASLAEARGEAAQTQKLKEVVYVFSAAVRALFSV